MRVVALTAIILGLFALEGCAAPTGASVRPDLPQTLGDKGAVIAGIEPLTGDMWFLSALIEKQTSGPLKWHTNVELKEDYFATVLRPGNYILRELSRNDNTASGTFNGVNVSISDGTWLKIDRPFTVRAGEITNLGDLVLIRNPAVKGRVLIRTVDNTADATRYLQKYFPGLLSSARSTAPVLAPGIYTRGPDLRKLRTFIAAYEARHLTHARYIAGPAGTVALIDHDAGGRPIRLHLIDTDVAGGIDQAAEDHEHGRFAFETSDGRLFVVHGVVAVERPIPPQIDDLYLPTLHLAGDHTIVIVGHDLNLFVSSDDGVTWRNDATARVDPSQLSTTGFAAVKGGYYIYESYPARLEYSPLGAPALQRITLPPEVKEIHLMAALKSGLLVEPNTMVWSDKTPYPFYVRAVSGGAWETRHMPEGGCRLADIRDPAGMRLRAVCTQDAYQSTDGGLTWSLAGS